MEPFKYRLPGLLLVLILLVNGDENTSSETYRAVPHIQLRNFVSNSSFSSSSPASSLNGRHNNQPKLRHQEIWSEINDSIVLNCSLRVNKDQHVVWHRKYDKMGVHVLTIESETFISDLRIRPIKQEFAMSTPSSQTYLTDSNGDNLKFTWNLEIRRLKRDDSALYYCVLNSENSYGQIYKLNVSPHLTMLNKTDIFVDTTAPRKNRTVVLACKYDDLIPLHSGEQIKWYLNKYRIRSNNQQQSATLEPIDQKYQNSKIVTNLSPRTAEPDDESSATESENQHQHNNNVHHYQIIETHSHETNSTFSKLIIHNFNHKYHSGRYRCQIKGLFKTVKVYSNQNDSISRLIFKQSVFSASSSSSSSMPFSIHFIFFMFQIFKLFSHMNLFN